MHGRELNNNYMQHAFVNTKFMRTYVHLHNNNYMQHAFANAKFMHTYVHLHTTFNVPLYLHLTTKN